MTQALSSKSRTSQYTGRGPDSDQTASGKAAATQLYPSPTNSYQPKGEPSSPLLTSMYQAGSEQSNIIKEHTVETARHNTIRPLSDAYLWGPTSKQSSIQPTWLSLLQQQPILHCPSSRKRYRSPLC